MEKLCKKCGHRIWGFVVFGEWRHYKYDYKTRQGNPHAFDTGECWCGCEKARP